MTFETAPLRAILLRLAAPLSTQVGLGNEDSWSRFDAVSG